MTAGNSEISVGRVGGNHNIPTIWCVQPALPLQGLIAADNMSASIAEAALIATAGMSTRRHEQQPSFDHLIDTQWQ
jgi:hypothetical protein